jgi:LPXTG-motif cell wall-anchored protein
MLKNRSSTLVFALAYVVFVTGVFLALGGAAYAQDCPTSAENQYCSEESQAVNVSVTGPSGPTATSGPSAPSGPSDTAGTAGVLGEALPNTGLSLLATALIGGALLVGGIALRRRERAKADAS